MSTPSIKKNYIYSLFYQLLTIITPFVTAPYVARVLGADGVGIYSYTSSYMTYFTLVSALGTASYGMREIAQCRNQEYEYSKKFWEIELLTVFTTSVCLVLWIVLVIISDKYKVYFMALTPSLIATMFDISWFYIGHEKIGYTVLWNSICKILGIICIFTFVKNKNDIVLYIFLNSLILLLGNVSMWMFLPKMLVKVSPKLFTFKRHFQETLIYFIPTIATTVYTVLDKTLIGIIVKDDFQNGYYEQATKVINIAKMAVFASVNTVMASRVSYLFAENRIDEIKARINKSMNFILLLGIAATFGIVAVARDFVPIFFGGGYDAVVELLYWMAPLILIIGVSNCLGTQYYTPAGLRAQSSKYIIIGAVTNLLMNITMIPYWGVKGAILGSIIAELVITILYIRHCNGFLSLRQLLTDNYKRLLAGIIMVIMVSLVRHFRVSGITQLCLEVFIGGVVYFMVLYLIKDEMLEGIVMPIIRKVQKNGKIKH